jgi:hypothetical protein
LGLEALEADSIDYNDYVKRAEEKEKENYPKEIKKRKDKLGL